MRSFYLMASKRCCLFIITIFSISNIAAQKISGSLKDEKSLPVAFANVSLLSAGDNVLKSSALTDSLGHFSLQAPSPGNYILTFTAIGFKEKKTSAFQIIAGTAKNMDVITLEAEAKNLDEVSVLALRPSIIQKPDRLVVSVEGTAMAAGNTAYTVLSKAPGVFIDGEGNIQLNGRAGVTVMIDNKLTYLSARDLRNLLEGMPAENVKNIEIITNPSAKYDAEGTSGILNINLRKNTQRGMNGSIYSSVNYNFKQTGYSYGTNLNFKGGAWNSFVNVDGVNRVGGREATFTRVFYAPSATTYFDQVATGNFKSITPASVRIGTDYTINSKHSVGMMAYYTYNKGADDFITETFLGNSPKQYYEFVKAENYNKGNFENITANIHYTGKLDTLGKQLTADVDYVKIKNHRESNLYNYFSNLSSGAKTQDILYAKVPAGFDIYSFKMDYVHPLNKDHKLELGGKVSHVVSDNDSRFYFNNGSLTLDPGRTNHFNYEENIYAAYLNWSGTLSKNIAVQAGIRAEQTEGTGISYTTAKINNRNYLDFFPSLFIQQKVSDNYGINYSYSRRLTRPNYGNLNPFRNYRDPYTWYEGNTELSPQYTHSFSIAQTFKKIYILTLSYQLNKDVMAEIPILDVANATTIYTTGNVDDGHNLSMTALAPIRIMKKWEAQNTMIVSYNKFSMMSNQGQIVNDQVFYMLQSNHTISLPKSFRMEVNLLYRGPAASGLYHMAAMHRVDVAFRKSFLNKKLDVSVNANDLFKGFRYLWTTNIGRNVNEFDQYFRWRSIGVTFRYNFSRGLKVDTKRRSTTVEEVNRT